MSIAKVPKIRGGSRGTGGGIGEGHRPIRALGGTKIRIQGTAWHIGNRNHRSNTRGAGRRDRRCQQGNRVSAVSRISADGIYSKGNVGVAQIPSISNTNGGGSGVVKLNLTG